MRITFITLKIDIVVGGGANRGLDMKLRSLRARGHDVRLITVFPELNRLPPEGAPYPVEAAPCANRGFRALQEHVVSIMKQNETRTDVYHIDGTTCLWAGGMYRKAGGRVPVAAYLSTYMEALNLLTYEPPDPSKGIGSWLRFHLDVRMVWLKHRLWVKTLGLPIARHLDLVFVPSPVTGEHYARFGFPADRIAVMPEFIDPGHFHPDAFRSEPFPSSFGSDKPFRLLHVGRLLRMKGVDLLIQAVAGLRRDERNVTATILGGGPQLERLKKLAETLGIDDAVTFLPWTEESDLSPAYAACDAFVHPCRFPEPLGRTIIEALFFGRPIVTSEHTGSAWAAGDAGVTAKMGSADDLKRALAELYGHPGRLTELSHAAPARVDFFDVRRWTITLEESLARLHDASRR